MRLQGHRQPTDVRRYALEELSPPKTARPHNIHERYHAHVYFDAASSDQARRLCAAAGTALEVEVGRFHEKFVGPHLRWSCQLKFDAAGFTDVIRWLDDNRDGLTVFVHGATGEDYADHTDHAYWLGDAVELDLTMFES